jgi:hypothetical protein
MPGSVFGTDPGPVVSPDDPAGPLVQGGALPDQRLQTLVQTRDHAAAELLEAVAVQPVVGEPQAQHVGAVDLLEDLGDVQRGLGGDAAAVQAGAPDLGLLDERDVESPGVGTEGGGVPGGAAAEDDHVVHAGGGVRGRHQTWRSSRAGCSQRSAT